MSLNQKAKLLRRWWFEKLRFFGFLIRFSFLIYGIGMTLRSGYPLIHAIFASVKEKNRISIVVFNSRKVFQDNLQSRIIFTSIFQPQSSSIPVAQSVQDVPRTTRRYVRLPNGRNILKRLVTRHAVASFWKVLTVYIIRTVSSLFKYSRAGWTVSKIAWTAGIHFWTVAGAVIIVPYPSETNLTFTSSNFSIYAFAGAAFRMVYLIRFTVFLLL